MFFPCNWLLLWRCWNTWILFQIVPLKSVLVFFWYQCEYYSYHFLLYLIVMLLVLVLLLIMHLNLKWLKLIIKALVFSYYVSLMSFSYFSFLDSYKIQRHFYPTCYYPTCYCWFFYRCLLFASKTIFWNKFCYK